MMEPARALELIERTDNALRRIETRLHLVSDADRSGVRRWVAQRRDGLDAARSQVATDGLGFIPLLIVGGSVAAAALGAWLWRGHEDAAATNRYLDCLERTQAQGYTPEQAAEVCRSGSGVPVWVWLAGAGIAGLALVAMMVKNRGNA